MNTIMVLEVVLHKLRDGGIAQWQSIRLQIERSLVQIWVPPPFFLLFVAHIILKHEHNHGVRSGSS